MIPPKQFEVTFRQAPPEANQKITNTGWPDPTKWINQLHADLGQWRELYDSNADAHMRRHISGNMVGVLLASLLELPQFRNDSVHYPLKDLMIFLSDLHKGRDHAWSAPRNFGGTNITNTAQGELKVWVRAAFHILRSNGFKPVEAYRRIAQGLNASGRTARKGNPIRYQLVQTWCLEDERPREMQVREKLEQWWVAFRAQYEGAQIVDERGSPTPEKQLVGNFVDRCWSLEHLRDRSIPGISE